MEIVALIATDSTALVGVCEYIQQRLPALGNSSDQGIELCPLAESDSIVTQPSSSDLLYRVDIAEDLSNISIFPSDILLYFEWECLVLLDPFEILYYTRDEWSILEFCLFVETLGRGIAETKILHGSIHGLLISLECFLIFVPLPLVVPWEVEWYIDRFDRDQWGLPDQCIG